MIKLKFIASLALITLIFASFFAIDNVQAVDIFISESQITSNTADQYYPDVYGDITVWQDNRNGNWDIYMYAPYVDMWHPEIQVTTSSASQEAPKIYGNIIVWQDDRNGNWDIYMYDVSTGVEQQITGDPTDQIRPAIYGDTVVWQDARNGYLFYDYVSYEFRGWNIYSYDLTTQTERQLTSTDTNLFPAISGNIVAYTKTVYGTFENHYLYYYNLLTNAEVRVLSAYSFANSESSYIGSIAFCESSIVFGYSVMPFMEYNIWNDEVAMKDISNGAVWTSAGFGVADQINPDISGESSWKYVVFEDNRFGNSEIGMHALLNNQDYRITDNPYRQAFPAIFSGVAGNFHYNRVVFMDNRNGNWDIYRVDFGWLASGFGDTPSAPTPLTPSRVISALQGASSRIEELPISDFAGVNDKVKENRKNVLLRQLDSAISNVEAASNTENLKLRSRYCQSAIDQLDGLIVKMDGWSLRGSADVAGSGFTPDWITYALYLDQGIRSCRNDLQTLLQAIS